jgi:hypothetical protein
VAVPRLLLLVDVTGVIPVPLDADVEVPEAVELAVVAF